MKIYKIINFLKDTIVPKKCYSCKIELCFFCEDCETKIFKFKPYCYICKKESSNFEVHKNCQKNIYFDKIIINYHYKESLIQKLIKDSKFFNRKDILEDFAVYLSENLLKNENIFNKENYLILPVPMNFIRKFKRWYNHSEVLAKEISRITWINFNKNILKRVRNSIQQSKLSKKQRELNLKETFKINQKYMSELDFKKIIIIDDVVSTWTTINEISTILKQSWALKIIWLCIASD